MNMIDNVTEGGAYEWMYVYVVVLSMVFQVTCMTLNIHALVSSVAKIHASTSWDKTISNRELRRERKRGDTHREREREREREN